MGSQGELFEINENGGYDYMYLPGLYDTGGSNYRFIILAFKDSGSN